MVHRPSSVFNVAQLCPQDRSISCKTCQAKAQAEVTHRGPDYTRHPGKGQILAKRVAKTSDLC
jgi:hypothetical protein